MDPASVTEPFRFSVDAHLGAGADHGAEVALARETRKEIQRLVREVSALCHSRMPENRFWPKFLGLVGSALASHGGVVWHRCDSRWVSTSHVGQIEPRILDVSASQLSSHDRLIAEVGDTAAPALVPPGAAWDLDEPGNPTESLAAVVPIPVDPDESVQWIVEQFLPLGGGPATHRGYLRFVAQMADLAAEYLRAHRLRSFRQQAEWSARLQCLLADLYEQNNPAAVHRKLVDALAPMVAAERVSLVRRVNGRLRVEAVSGVDEIDPLAPAVSMIRECAAEVDSSVGFTLAVADPLEGSTAKEAGTDTASPEGTGDVAAASGELVLRGVAVLDQRGEYRLVVEDRPGVDAPQDLEPQWPMLVRHLGLVLQPHGRAAGGRFLASSSGNSTTASPLRRAAMWGGVLAVISIAAFLPFPLVVTAEGRLEPVAQQTVYAPHDGIVAQLWVRHGSQVRAGDPLLQLFDAELEQNLHSLVSRRETLVESILELERRLARDGSRDREQAERLQAQVNLNKDQLRGVDGELAILRSEEQSMLVCASRDGLVDAWQANERLENRPVDRGQALLRVIDPRGNWNVQVEIPQSRIDSVLAARDAGNVAADMVVRAFPNTPVSAALAEIGPVVRGSGSGEAFGVALFSVNDGELPILQAGTPVQLAIDCGTRSLGYIACQDLIRMVQRTVRLYW